MPSFSAFAQSPKFRLASIAALVIATIVAGSNYGTAVTRFKNLPSVFAGSSALRLKRKPHLMIWAWEYAADLRFIDKSKTGVAYLAAKANLVSDSIIMQPRLQKLLLSPGTYTMAVVRIEPNHLKQPATLTNRQADDLVAKVIETLGQQKVDALQIDFDARQSERSFYKRFLIALRQRMPADMPLSITSLASWCLMDTWITDATCDEVVPMFFCMGHDRKRMLSYLRSNKVGEMVPKQISLGLSIDEPDVLGKIQEMPPNIFLFSTHGWTAKEATAWINKFQQGGLNWKDLAQAN